MLVIYSRQGLVENAANVALIRSFLSASSNYNEQDKVRRGGYWKWWLYFLGFKTMCNISLFHAGKLIGVFGSLWQKFQLFYLICYSLFSEFFPTNSESSVFFPLCFWLDLLLTQASFHPLWPHSQISVPSLSDPQADQLF